MNSNKNKLNSKIIYNFHPNPNSHLINAFPTSQKKKEKEKSVSCKLPPPQIATLVKQFKSPIDKMQILKVFSELIQMKNKK